MSQHPAALKLPSLHSTENSSKPNPHTKSADTGLPSNFKAAARYAKSHFKHRHHTDTSSEARTVVAALRRTRSFSSFSRDDIVAILDAFTKQSWAKGDCIVRERQRSKALHVIVDGTCDITVDGQQVNSVSQGYCVGEAALRDKTDSLVTATVVSHHGAKTWDLDKLQFKLLTHEHRQRMRRRELSGAADPVTTGKQQSETRGSAADNADGSQAPDAEQSKSKEAEGTRDVSLKLPLKSPSSDAEGDDQKKLPRVSPRLTNYSTVKWIKSRHEKGNAKKAVSRLKKKEQDQVFNEALHHIYSEFHHDRAGKISWNELDDTIKNLEKALPAGMVELVRIQWARLVQQRQRNTLRTGVSERWLDFDEFAAIMRRFDFQTGTGKCAPCAASGNNCNIFDKNHRPLTLANAVCHVRVQDSTHCKRKEWPERMRKRARTTWTFSGRLPLARRSRTCCVQRRLASDATLSPRA